MVSREYLVSLLIRSVRVAEERGDIVNKKKFEEALRILSRKKALA